jgi:hypothetical protein
MQVYLRNSDGKERAGRIGLVAFNSLLDGQLPISALTGQVLA